MIDQKSQAKAETFSNMFQFQGGIFHNALENLTEEDALKKPYEHSNHINWLLGHILHCRFMLGNMLGMKADNPFGEIYWTAIEDKAYPSVEEIVKEFPKISEKVIAKIASMTNDELDARPAPDKPSMTEMVSFFVYHEAYHIGQIGYARKAIGLKAMKSH